MSYIDAFAKNVLDVYHKALIDVDMQVYNKMYEHLNGAAATGFLDGWIAATMWMADNTGASWDFDKSGNLEARDAELRRRFPSIFSECEGGEE